MDRKTAAALLRPIGVLFLLVLCVGAARPAQARGKKKTAKAAANMVWPLPPEKPRIRFLAEISSTRDVQPRKKAGFLERLAKIQPEDEGGVALAKPYGVTTDAQGRIYVTDTKLNEVFIFDRQHREVQYVSRQSGIGFRTPVGVAVDGEQRLWVSDSAAQRVYAFNPDLTPAMILGQGQEFTSPAGLAIDHKRRRLYVVDTRKHAVLVFDTRSGALLHQFGEHGSAQGAFNFPTNITVDYEGRIYVVDTLNARVQVFGPDYKFLSMWGSRGDGFGRFARPKGIGVDSFGNLYVVDAVFNNFQIFDQQHRLLMFVGGFGEAPGAFALPAGLHVDGENRIYVADQNNRRIQIFQLLDGAMGESPPSNVAGASTPGVGKEVPSQH